MPLFRFTYKTPSEEKNNILIEDETREDAITTFETDFPTLKWWVVQKEKS